MQDKKSELIAQSPDDTSIVDLTTTVAAQYKNMTPADWREAAVEEYLYCILCGGEFKFTHLTDFATLSVHEESHCPHCNIRGAREEHVLQ